MKHWAMDYDKCTSCHTTDKKHHGDGLCTTCYHREYQRKKPPVRQSDLDKSRAAGYELGRYAGRTQVADAVSDALKEWDVYCAVHTDTLYITFPDKTITREL